MEHLATINLIPDPSADEQAGNIESLEVERLRGRSILIIKTPDQKSFQLNQKAVEELITALQEGLRRIAA